MSIRKIVRVLFPFAAAGLLGACSKSEEFTPNVPNPTNDEVVFALQVPGGNSATRSLTGPDEYAVETLDVLVFDHNTGAFLSRGFNKTEPSVVGGVVSFYVGIVPEPGVTKYDYILLANARDAIRTCLENSNGEIPRSYTKTSIQADLKANVVAGTGWIVDKSNLNYKAMPMWGEINDQELNKGANYNGTLTRMTTRVDLEVDLEGDSAGDTFTLNQVKLHNYFTTGYVIPKASQWNSSTQKPIGSSAAGLRPSTPPTPIDYSSKIVSNKIEYSIYTFETTTEDYSTDACLLVNATWTPAGGTAKTGWYRLDFVNTDKTTHANTPFTLTRNHHYQMAVTMINGPGFLNESEALASLPGTIETRVQTWVPGDMGDVVFDGTNYLRVNQKEWEIDREPRTDADTDNKLEIETDCSEWKITAVTETDGTTPCTWLTPSVLQGGPGASTISLNATANKDAGAVDRTAFVHIQAGRLKFKVEVTQLNRTKAFVRITDMSGDPISELFFRANNGTPDMAPDPQYFKVEWSPKDQPLKMLRTPIGNPFECWNWVNVINGWTEIPASYNGSYSFTIDPYPITTAQIAGDPFYSKATMLKLIVDGGGGSTADASILLRQVNFDLLTDVQSDYALNSQTETIHVRSNFAWKITSVTDPHDILQNESALVGKMAGNNTITGDPVSFTMAAEAADGSKDGKKATITFENLQDGSIWLVAITAKEDLYYVGYFGGKLMQNAAGEWQFERPLYVKSRDEGQVVWATTAFETLKVGVIHKKDGKGNTLALNYGKSFSSKTGFPAANLCFQKNDNWESITAVEDANYVWYLPALDQLIAINEVRQTFDQDLSDTYWSSSENFQSDSPVSRAKSFIFTRSEAVIGSSNVSNKSFSARVRCVREIVE